jgi:hypothetical protein
LDRRALSAGVPSSTTSIELNFSIIMPSQTPSVAKQHKAL